MKIINLDCFEVQESYDRDSRHVAYFQHEQDAKEFAKKSPYYSVYSVQKQFIIYESIQDMLESKKALAVAELEHIIAREKRRLGLE